MPVRNDATSTPADGDTPRDPQDSGTSLFEAMAAAFSSGGWNVGDQLPAHLPGCFGCGQDNPHGIGIVVRVAEEPDAVTCTHVFDHRHRGAPGVAHGGAVAAAVDDLFGFVLVRILTPAVTRDLQLRYRLPVRLDVETELTARLAARDGRELHLDAEVRQEDLVVVTANATFIEVDVEHLAAPAARFGLGRP